MLIVKGAERYSGCFNKNVQAAFRKMQIEVGHLRKNVTHRHIKSASFFKGEPPQVVDEIVFESQPILVRLFYKLLTTETERVARLPGHVPEELLKSRCMLRFFFQAHVAIHFDKTTQFFHAHFVVALLRESISALDAVQRHAVRPQNTLYFSQHRVFFFSFDMAQDIKADYVVEAGIGER